MNKLHRMVLPCPLVAAALLLGGCGGSEDIEGPADLESTSPGATLAVFEGEIIDLSRSWREAEVCVVLGDGEPAECFRTEAEAASRGAELEGAVGSAESELSVTASCSSPLHVYEHDNYRGRHLTFGVRQKVYNFTAYGFNDKMSSYKVGACRVTFWEHVDNKGDKVVANAREDTPSVRRRWGDWWNDRASSIWIW